MAEPRSHHLVAKMYQRGFARRRSRKTFESLVIDRATGTGSLRNIDNVFKRRDWNSATADGVVDTGAETFYADQVDGPAAPSFQAMREQQFPLDEQDRTALAIWMSAQLSRGRAPRESLVDAMQQVGAMVLQLTVANYTDERWMSEFGAVPDDATKARLLDPSTAPTYRPTNASLLATFLQSILGPAEVLARRTWTLVRFREPCLLTGENPVVHINPEGHQTGYGVMTAEQMYLPVTPSLALLLSHPWTRWQEKIIEGSESLAERLNWAIVTAPANSELLVHPDTKRHPVPGILLLSQDTRWPWPPDPEAKPPGWYLPDGLVETGPRRRVRTGGPPQIPFL